MHWKGHFTKGMHWKGNFTKGMHWKGNFTKGMYWKGNFTYNIHVLLLPQLHLVVFPVHLLPPIGTHMMFPFLNLILSSNEVQIHLLTAANQTHLKLKPRKNYFLFFSNLSLL